MTKAKSGDTPLWKTILLIVVSLGGLSVVLGFYPTFSPIAIGLGVMLTLISIIAAVVTDKDRAWWKEVLFANSWLIMFLGMAVRAWGALLSGIIIPGIVLVGLYVLAWLMPAINSSLSERIYLSQVAPESKSGRVLLALLIAIAPSVAGVSGLIGYYGVKYISDNGTAVLLGILAAFVAIAGGQAIAHQLHRNRYKV
jgi:hypothetical protein